MTSASSSMAALLSRAARPRALLRRARSHRAVSLEGASVCAASRPLAWRGSAAAVAQTSAYSTKAGTKKPLPSLVISEAFDESRDGDDDSDGEHADGDAEMSFGLDLDDDDELGDVAEGSVDAVEDDDDAAASDLSQDEQRALASQFRFAMGRKKQWMAQLVARGEFDTVLKVVVECYEPLYASHPMLQDETCLLCKSYEDAAAVAHAKTRFRPKWYDDKVTQITEQEAMALFVKEHRPELAMAVFRHREWLAGEIPTATVQRGGNVLADDVLVDFTKHLRSYYSFAIGACYTLGDHAQVFSIYENALESGVFPTANMTLTYLNSLIAKREFEAAMALFEQIQKDDRPTNVYFYRQMLFFSRVTTNSKMMTQIVDEMKIKGFKLRREDYLNAIFSLDPHYFKFVNEDNVPQFVDESYSDCIARITEQEDHPEKYKQLEAACEKVIKLFEEMTEDELITPTHERFFPRIIAAAFFLHDYDRAAEYVAKYEKLFKKKLADSTAVKVSVNMLLLKDDPKAALALIFDARQEELKKEGLNTNAGKLGGRLVSAVHNVVEYINQHHDSAAALELLAELDAKKLLTAISEHDAVLILQTLAQDKANISDFYLDKVVTKKYWAAFRVRSHGDTLTKFVQMCVPAERWWVISKILSQRDRTRVRTVSPALALALSEQVLGDLTDIERLEISATLAHAVDFSALTPEERLALCFNIIRALHALQSAGSQPDHRRRHIRRLQDQYLRVKGRTIPHDVQQILMQYA